MSDDYDMESNENKKASPNQHKRAQKSKKKLESELHHAIKLQAALNLGITSHNTDCEEFPSEIAEVFIKADESSPSKDKDEKIDLDKIKKDLPLLIKNEEQLLTMCNLKSFDTLLQLVRLLDEKFPPYQRCLISTRDCIILTLARLTLNITFAALSVFYRKCNGATIGEIFFHTIKRLASILETVVAPLPQDEKVLKWYDRKSGITQLDCWIIKLEKPRCEKCYFERYYHHMKEYTVDFLVSLKPSGIVISLNGKYYEPSTSDEDEDYEGYDEDYETYTKRMEKTDTVMPDLNYSINKETLDATIKLFGQEKSKTDVKCTRKHLVSMRKWFNQFKIFEDIFPWSFVDSVHEIFVVCSALSVLQTPLLKVDEF